LAGELKSSEERTAGSCDFDNNCPNSEEVSLGGVSIDA
jgi:hypothetical protein